MAPMETKAALVTVSGRVQGVFYRAGARDTASSLGLSGWVRNLPDGAVELFVEGDEVRVREMIAWCRRGPPAAAVEDVRVEWTDPRREAGFRIRYGN